MTTPNPIVLPTSPETRAKLESAYFHLDSVTYGILESAAKVVGEYWRGPVFDLWLRAPNGAAAEMHGGDCIQLGSFMAVASILGIYQCPPGFRLVPEEEADAAVEMLTIHMEETRRLGQFEAAKAIEETIAALSPREAEK